MECLFWSELFYENSRVLVPRQHKRLQITSQARTVSETSEPTPTLEVGRTRYASVTQNLLKGGYSFRVPTNQPVIIDFDVLSLVCIYGWRPSSGLISVSRSLVQCRTLACPRSVVPPHNLRPSSQESIRVRDSVNVPPLVT